MRIFGTGGAVLRLEERRIDGGKLRRNHSLQPPGGDAFHVAEAGQELRVVVFDRRGDIAGEDFGGVMEQRHCSRPVGVQRTGKMDVADGAEHMRQQGYLERVLRHILR
ncbi:hypothetical protein D3C75_942670 [compost metagenome]